MTTVTNMWDLAKDLADMTGSGFPIDARGIDYANTALRILHVALANAHNGDYFRSEDSISVVAGTESYALPSDFMRAIKLFYEPTGGSYRYEVKKYHLDNMAGLRTSPVTAGTVVLWYCPTPTAFTLVGDTLPAIYPVGSSDFIAYHMAIQLLNREESFEQSQMLKQTQHEIMRSIIDIIEPRDETPDGIADVYNRWGGAGDLAVEARDHNYLYRIMGANVYFSESNWRGV